MDRAVEAVNRNCPMAADSPTRLDNASAKPDNTLQCNYTILRPIDELPGYFGITREQRIENMKANIRLSASHDKEMQALAAEGVTLR